MRPYPLGDSKNFFGHWYTIKWIKEYAFVFLFVSIWAQKINILTDFTMPQRKLATKVMISKNILCIFFLLDIFFTRHIIRNI